MEVCSLYIRKGAQHRLSLNTSEYKNRIERLLSLSPNPDQEAWIEIAWCDVNIGNLEQAKQEMEAILERVDPISYEGATAELRAKLWWRLGRCLWLMDGEYRADPAHAFTAFITSLKRNPAFAPAYTSLGFYYEDILQPPDLVRSSKCFQKAFELDARETKQREGSQRVLQKNRNGIWSKWLLVERSKVKVEPMRSVVVVRHCKRRDAIFRGMLGLGKPLETSRSQRSVLKMRSLPSKSRFALNPKTRSRGSGWARRTLWRADMLLRSNASPNASTS